jgi:hypothetical protein
MSALSFHIHNTPLLILGLETGYLGEIFVVFLTPSKH